MLKKIQENLLDNVILKGVKGIGKVNIRKIAGSYVKGQEKYDSKDIWVLDTTGSNLKDILAMDICRGASGFMEQFSLSMRR